MGFHTELNDDSEQEVEWVCAQALPFSAQSKYNSDTPYLKHSQTEKHIGKYRYTYRPSRYIGRPLVFLFSDSCSWVLCLSWTVKLSAVLQKNPSGPTNSVFFSIFCVFEPFSTMTVWFWDPSSHTEDNWRTHTATITEGANAHWCFRKKNDAWRAGDENILTEWRCVYFS